MQILIVSATEIEIEPLIRARPDLAYCITGVGAAATTLSIADALNEKRYDLLIQAGVGGSFDFEEAGPAAVVAVRRDRFADLGVFEDDRFSSVYDMDLADQHAFPFTNGWLERPEDAFSFLPHYIKKVDAITVNAIQADDKLNKIMRAKYEATIESMEGAAFHYVCLKKKVPFLQLRAVSNLVGDRNKANWKLLQAFENLSNSITQILNTISNEN